MNVIDAAHRIAHGYPGGLKVLAARMDLNAQVLNNKVLASCETNHLTLEEAVVMQEYSGRSDILFAECDRLGFLPPMKKPIAGPLELGPAIASFCAQFADYLREVQGAIVDQAVSTNEIRRLEKELAELVAEGMNLQSMLAARSPHQG